MTNLFQYQIKVCDQQVKQVCFNEIEEYDSTRGSGVEEEESDDDLVIENNNINGHGIYTWPDGIQYDGQWKQNKKHGQGKLKWLDGSSLTPACHA